MIRYATILACSLALMVAVRPLAEAFPPTASFCLIPVDTSAVQHLKKSYDGDRPFYAQMAGMPSPTFGHWNKLYSIGQDLKLHVYTAPLPEPDLFWSDTSIVDEPWNSRWVGIRAGPPYAILEMRYSETQFHIIFEDQSPAFYAKPGMINLHYLNSIIAIPNKTETIVGAMDGPVAKLDGDTLTPWPEKGILFAHNVQGMDSAGYSPALKTTFILDGNLELTAWTDDGHWFHLGSVGSQYFDQIMDLPGVGAVGVKSGKLAVVILYDSSNSGSPFSVLEPEKGLFSSFQWLHLSELFAQVLRYENGFSFITPGHWQVLTAQGFEDVPGGATGLDPALYSWPKDLISIHRSLIEGLNSWYLYDGRTMQPITGSDPTTMGPNIYVGDFDSGGIYDLTAIGHALLVRSTGVFDITQDGHMVPLPQLKGMSRFYNWPEAHVAIATNGSTSVLVDNMLHILPMPPFAFSPYGSAPYSPARFLPLNSIVGSTEDGGLSLLVDLSLKRSAPCPEQRDQK